jgi:hypothetical protein
VIGVRHLGCGPWPSSYLVPFRLVRLPIALSSAALPPLSCRAERKKRLDTFSFFRLALRRMRSTSQAKAPLFVAAKGPPRRRYQLCEPRGSSTLRAACASSTRFVSAGSRDAREVAVRREVRKEKESEGDEHVHDSGALLKGRRVIGGARGRSREGTRTPSCRCTSSLSPSPVHRRCRPVLIVKRAFTEQLGIVFMFASAIVLSANILEGIVVGFPQLSRL